MTKEVKEFLEKITIADFDFEEVVKEANALLREEFKNNVLEVFQYIKDGYNSQIREAVLEGDKMKFICECYYSTTKRKFVNENFGKLDEILSILKEYIESEGEANE